MVIDSETLRTSRRARLFSAMADADIDVMILGRPANVRFASGARQLWTAGARPFGPGCVVVGATGRVHLLSTWDEGIPADIPHEDLYGLTWNAEHLVSRVGAVPGLRDARRVGTDGVGPATEQLVSALAPSAQMVDATGALRAARSAKDAEEISCLRTAAGLAGGALTELSSAVVPGVTERELVGRHSARLAALGAPTPGWEASACAASRRGPVRLRRLASDRPIAAGEIVALTAAATYGGYEALVSRPVVCPVRAGASGGGAEFDELLSRARAAEAGLIQACRPGATGADIVQAWAATGEPMPAEPLAWGTGLGMEPPVVGSGVGAGERLEEGMTMTVQAWVAEEGVGGVLLADLVLVCESGPEVLTGA